MKFVSLAQTSVPVFPWDELIHTNSLKMEKSSKSPCSHHYYSDDEKLSYVDRYLHSGLSIYRFSKENRLSDGVLKYWLRKFAPEYDTPTIMKGKQDESEQIRALKQELKLARLEASRQKMRADLYNEMIDVAEEMFNVPIRKKASTKQ